MQLPSPHGGERGRSRKAIMCMVLVDEVVDSIKALTPERHNRTTPVHVVDLRSRARRWVSTGRARWPADFVEPEAQIRHRQSG